MSKPSFHRTLSVTQGTVLAITLVIGSGVLGLPGIVVQEIGPQIALLAWLGTACAVIPFIVVFSRLGTQFPSSPGLLSYHEYSFGKAGRNAAGLLLLSCFPFGLPALLLIGGSFLQALAGLDEKWVPAAALGILTLATILNARGLRTTARVNTFSVAAVVAFILLLAILRSEELFAGIRAVPAALSAFDGGTFGALWKGAALIFWAFLGWENLGFSVQEVRNPERAVPLMFGLSFVIVTALFLIPAFLCTGAALQGSGAVAGATGLLSLLPGSVWRIPCGLVLVLLILGNANSWVYTCSRLVHAEASDGLLPRRLGKLATNGVPLRGLWAGYVVVATAIVLYAFTGVKIASFMLLVNQNFLFLFLGSIWTYAKVEKSRRKYGVVPLAVVACGFFLSGFSLAVLFPLALIALGWGKAKVSRGVA